MMRIAEAQQPAAVARAAGVRAPPRDLPYTAYTAAAHTVSTPLRHKGERRRYADTFERPIVAFSRRADLPGFGSRKTTREVAEPAVRPPCSTREPVAENEAGGMLSGMRPERSAD